MINKILFALLIALPLYFLFEYGLTEKGFEYSFMAAIVALYFIILKNKKQYE